MSTNEASERQRSLPANIPATLEEIRITSKLQTRPHREPNLLEEGESIRILARMLKSATHELVDMLLLMALSLCKADTAGLSVLETLPNGEEIFRWTNLAGTLKRFVGGSTKRHFSPCGVCVDSNAPELFTYPERRFLYLKEALDVPIVEALVIPVPLGDGAPSTIWILTHKRGVEFDAEDVRIMTGLADFTCCALELNLSERKLRERHAELEATVLTRTAQLRQLTAKLLTLQDEERRRIARDLHDSAGQYLSGIQINLDAALRDPTLSAPLASRISDSREMVDRCLSEVRTISYLLHPPLLDEVGLWSALSWYVDGFAARSGIQVELKLPAEIRRLPSEVEIALFRAVQQGLVNIHRHSGSKVARIMTAMDAEKVILEICDEGCGIPPDTLKGFNEGTQLPGVGIAGIRERIRDMGGQFTIGSANPGGTTVTVSLPLPQ